MDLIQIILLCLSVLGLSLSIILYYKPYQFWSQMFCDLERPKRENKMSIILYIFSMVFLSLYLFSLPFVILLPSYQSIFNLFIIIGGVSCLLFAICIFEITPKLHVIFSMMFMICITGIFIMIGLLLMNKLIIFYLMIHVVYIMETCFAFIHDKPIRIRNQAIAQKIQSICLFITLFIFHIF